MEQWVSVNEKIPNRTYKDIGRVGNKGYQTKDSPAPTGKSAHVHQGEHP
ncbi:hypothetical protein SRIMM317S_04443 [Streptomyces rimosus subsp. rimosus]